MSLDYICQSYGVPANRGQRIRYTGDKSPKATARDGTITGAEGPHLRIRMDGDSFASIYHPTWEIEYLPTEVRP